MKRRLFSLFLALVMCLSLLPTAAFAEGDTDTTDTTGTTDDTTITGTTTTGETGDTTITTTGGKDSATAAPAGKDEDATAAPTPVVQSLAPAPVALAAGFTHTNHCTCATEHTGEKNGCSGSDLTLTPYPNLLGIEESLPNSGSYYLTDDITLSSTWNVTGILCLCLNGHTITANGDFPVITVHGTARLVLTDCQGTGTITHSTGKTGSGVKVESGGTFNMYGGSITGNSGTLRTNIADGTSGNCGGGVYIAPTGTFNMYGGSITDNTAAGSGFACGGGGVYIEPITNSSTGTTGGTFNMHGGSITGNKAIGDYHDGGGVFVGDCGVFNMSGGTISGNSATKGGGVYADGGLFDSINQVSFTMSGGSIIGNNATEEGGGVYGGAFHGTIGSNESLRPNETAQAGSKFEMSGTASVTGNTLGGTLNTTSIYTGGTANNMYVPSWIYSIHVANSFTGSFGVTVDEGDWTDEVSTGGTNIHGTYWKVVRYEVTGSSSTSGAGNITYDNERFTFHSKSTVNEGKLTCNHLCGTTGGGSNYKCSICGSASVVAEVTLADGTTKRCYENLPAAIENADGGGTVKLLKDVTIDFISGNYSLSPGTGNTVTLDLNGKSYKVTGTPITIKNGTLEITGNTGSINNVAVANSATLIVSKKPTIGTLTVNSGGTATINSTNPTITNLIVNAGGTATLKGGKYSYIKVNEGRTCNELLADGYAYQLDYTNGTSVIASGAVGTLESGSDADFSIVSHTCNFKNSARTCTCGRECPHSSINDDGECTDCEMQMVARIGTGATAKYFATLKAAIAAAADGNTITLLADHEVSDNLTIGIACTLDLNGQTLTIGSGKKLTVSAAVTIKGAAGSQISGDGELEAGASANLTIEGNPTISELKVTDASATVQLKGGTYGKIDASDADKKLTSLLASGYKFKSSADDSDTLYSSAEEDKSCQGIKVVQCDTHGMYDNGTNRCMFCNTAFAVSVQENTSGVHPYYCQTLSEAMTYIATLSDTTTINIKLLGNVTETAAIDYSGKNASGTPLKTTLNLNGQMLTGNITLFEAALLDSTADTRSFAMEGSGTLAGTLTVKGGTVNIANGTITKLDVKPDGNAKLSGGTFGTIVVAGTDKAVGSLLEDGYSYRSTASGTAWVGSSPLGGASLTNVSVQLIPLTGIQVGLAVGSGSTITYGDSTSTTTLTATANKPTDVTAAPTYSWSRQKVGGTTTSNVGSDATLTVKGSDLAAGEYDFSCTVTVDGYSLESTVRITVNKANLGVDIQPTANSLTFKTTNASPSVPEAQQLVTAPTGLPEGCTVYYRLGITGDFTTDIPTATDAGTYTVQWYITGNDNYYDTGSETAPQSLSVTIKPMKVMKPAVGAPLDEGYSQLHFRLKFGSSDSGLNSAPNQTYTGSAITPEVQLENYLGYVIPESGYSVAYSNNKDVGTATITITDTDLNDNFEIEASTINFAIVRKELTLNPGTYTHYTTTRENITVDLDTVAKAMGMPTDDGPLNFSFDAAGNNTTLSGTFDGSINNTSKQLTGALASISGSFENTIFVTSNNYRGSFNLKIKLTEKTIPTVSVTDFTKTYDGAAVTLDDLTKSVNDSIDGGWKWNAPTGKPTNVADSGKYMLTFTPTNSDDFSAVTTTVQVTINAKSLADSNITATADGGTYTGEPITPTNLTVTYKIADDRMLTLEEGTDYTVSGDTSKTDAGTYSLTITGKGNYTGTKTVDWTIAPCPVGINSTGGGSKLYDGTTDFPPTAVSAAFTTGSSALSFAPGTHYNVSNVRSEGADVGEHPVSATVTLVGDNYVFAADNGQFYTSAGGKTATMYANCSIWPYPLETRPTVKESVIKLQQDVSVNNGSHPLFGNVNAALMDVSDIDENVLGTLRVIIPASVDIDLDGELHFALGTLPAKVSAQIDAAGMLTYSISGGKAGEKFAIPVTVTMPNLASYEFVRYTQEQINELVEYAMAQAERNDEDVTRKEILEQIGEGYVLPQSITLSFTVEVELTGSSRQVTDNDPFAPIHRQPIFTDGSTGSGSTGNGSGVASPNTGDAGIAVYAMLSLSAALGMCATGCTILSRKRRRG